MQKFIHLYSLGFVDYDGKLDKDAISKDAKHQADVISCLLEEEIDDVDLIVQHLRTMFCIWIHDTGGKFSEYIEKSLEVLGVTGYNHFSRVESLLESKLFNNYVVEFLVHLTIHLAEFTCEISLEDIFIELMLKGVPYAYE